MHIRFLLLILFVIITGGLIFYFWSKGNSKVSETEPVPEQTKTMETLTLKSSAFEHNGFIPRKYTCQGEDINPPLIISGVSPEAKSLVLIMDDPDAPMGTWIHWTVWNIPPTTPEIGENSKPEGIEGVTSFGKPGYGGPCPPSGTHRYFFKLYALDITLDLPTSAKKEDLEKTMAGHILDRAELVGLYKKE